MIFTDLGIFLSTPTGFILFLKAPHACRCGTMAMILTNTLGSTMCAGCFVKEKR